MQLSARVSTQGHVPWGEGRLHRTLPSHQGHFRLAHTGRRLLVIQGDFPVPLPLAPQGWGDFQKMNGCEVG